MGDAKIASKKDTAIVVVGMENSKKWGKCLGAEVDAKHMSSLLKPYGDMEVLRDGSATVKSVHEAISRAVQKPLCIFYYSGHGGRERNKSGVNGWSEFLCLNDAGLHDFDLWSVIQQSNGRVVAIFDCCHSATMFRAAGEEVEEAPEMTGFSFSMLRGPLMAGSDVNLLSWSGCPSESYSYGGADGGVLTNGLLKGFSASHTYDEAWDRMKRNAASQGPVRTVIGTGFKGTVFR